MQKRTLLLAGLAALSEAQSINPETIAVATPSTVFALPVVYATRSGAPAVTATTLAVGAQATSDPQATKIFSNAAQAAAAATQGVRKRDAGTICVPQPTGISHTSTPATPAGFMAAPSYPAQALAAAVPSGYTQTFSNLNASNSATQYMGYTLLSSYDPQTCATQCSGITGCNAFNIYFERDPSVDPNSDCCANPPSYTNIKCAFWGDAITTANANNFGQWRNQFEVVIAGSNGYVSTAYLNKPQCQAYTNTGGIQVWTANNVNNQNAEWWSISSTGAISNVAGSINAATNGTQFAIPNNSSPLPISSGPGCGNVLLLNPSGPAIQKATFGPSNAGGGLVAPICSHDYWYLTSCAINNSVWQAMVCSNDNYQGLYWIDGQIPDGCQWVGLWWHPASNPWAAS